MLVRLHDQIRFGFRFKNRCPQDSSCGDCAAFTWGIEMVASKQNQSLVFILIMAFLKKRKLDQKKNQMCVWSKWWFGVVSLFVIRFCTPTTTVKSITNRSHCVSTSGRISMDQRTLLALTNLGQNRTVRTWLKSWGIVVLCAKHQVSNYHVSPT